MACTLIPDIPALFCCPGGRQRYSDMIALRAITYGFAGKHLPGERYEVYSRCTVVFTISGTRFSDGHVYSGTRTVQADITLDQNGLIGEYNVSDSHDAGWDENGAFVLRNLTGSATETRASSKSWITRFPWFANFVAGGNLDASYTVEAPFSIEDVMGPLFAALDAYELSDVPVLRGVLKGFHPIAHDLYNEPNDIFHPGGAAESDRPWSVAAVTQFTATVDPLGHPGLADGYYGPPVSGSSLVPMCRAFGVIASKTKVWAESRICEVRKFTTSNYDFTSTTTQELCQVIGGTALENAGGLIIDRPQLSAPAFITGGLTSAYRARFLNYEDPFYQTVPNPTCCGFEQ